MESVFSIGVSDYHKSGIFLVSTKDRICNFRVQSNLRTEDTLGPRLLSSRRRLSSFQRLTILHYT